MQRSVRCVWAARERLCPAHTVQTKRRCGIGGEAFFRNLVAAVGAKPIFAFVYAQKGGADALTLSLTVAGLGLGHGLTLQRIHPGKPPNGLLIQLNGGARLRARCILGIEGFQAVLELGAEVVHGRMLGTDAVLWQVVER